MLTSENSVIRIRPWPRGGACMSVCRSLLSTGRPFVNRALIPSCRSVVSVLLSVLISGVCLHTGEATMRRASSQGVQRRKPLLLCTEEERQCEHAWNSNSTEELNKCSIVERRYCAPHSQIEDCCMLVTAPSVVEVCSRFAKDSATAMISCRQFRKELSTASSASRDQSPLHMVLPKGASSIQMYGLGLTPGLAKIYVEPNRSQSLFLNNADMMYNGVRIRIKSKPTEGWTRILVHQRITKTIRITFEAVSSVIFYYLIPISEAGSEQSSAQGGQSSTARSSVSLFCILSAQNYHWEHGQLGQCSTTCGIGKRYRPLRCIEYTTRRVVDNSNCACREPPPVRFEPCGNTSCEPRWATGRWSNCSTACGQGYQQREVSCVRDISEESFELVHSSYCSGQDAPSSLQSCEGRLCLHLWVPGPWKECSSRCGSGVQVRDVKCRMLNGSVVLDSACDGQIKPAVSQQCNLNPQCYYEWGQPSEWGECYGLCRTSNRGTKHRTVRCVAKHRNGTVLSDSVSETFCEADKKPVDSVPCEISCNLGEWRVAGIIRDCNGTCGNDAYRVKKWACYNEEGSVIHSWRCPLPAISFTSERCNLPPCAPPADCRDSLAINCTELLLWNNVQCDNYVSSLCCRSCHSNNG